MISLDRRNTNNGFRVVETPQELVPRLTRLETDDETLIKQLVLLGRVPLERLFHVTQNALARVGGNRHQNVRPTETAAPQIITRESTFGD